ncbi:MAG: DUF1579 domain-containing protein [Phycisphaerae bacterium]|nr:DUF1579 domain-containing protein [Phycisphaerae bacterium]
MTPIRSLVLTAVASAAGFVAAYSTGTPQPADPPAAAGGPDMQKAMEAWQATMMPGKAHEGLKNWVGKWNTVMKTYMGGPGAPPTESKGAATFEMVLGGRFVLQKTEGTMMGMPMNGLGLTGYDNGRKLYTGTWCDTMGTAIMTMAGSMSQDGKVLTMFGQMDEPMTGEVGKTVKFVTRQIDKDNFVFEAWEVLYGNDFKAFEVVYTRAK